MPHPKFGETKNDFMKRCIPELVHEGRETRVAIPICYSIFGKENTVGDTSEEEYRRTHKKDASKYAYDKKDKTKLYMLHY